MSEYLMLSIKAASVVYFLGMLTVFSAAYAIGLIFEWRRRK